MGSNLEAIQKKLNRFKKRYYLDIAIRGSILTLTFVVLYFILAVVLENSLWLDSTSRLLLILLFVGICLGCIAYFLGKPILYWISKKGIDDEQSAKYVGDHLPTVRDRLLNLIQLSKVSSPSPLAFASIEQKSKEFAPLQLEAVVDIRENNKRYLKFLAIPLALLVMIFLINANMITESTTRIIHFNEKFAPKAPFDFVVANESLNAFYNEDFVLKIQLRGSAIPDQAYLVTDTRKIKLTPVGPGEFEYVFENLQHSVPFQVQAAGFYSPGYNIELVNRPEVVQFQINLDYPRYLQRKSDVLSNTGNIEIPEGTIVQWKIQTAYTQNATLLLHSTGDQNTLKSSDNQLFTFNKQFFEPDRYEIFLKNNNSDNKERIAYRIDVIKDAYPQISVNNFKDSILYRDIVLGGLVADDYGLTRLKLQYKISRSRSATPQSGSIDLPLLKDQNQQSFTYQWGLDSLQLKPGQYIEYYLEVWDNDGVNGHKSTKSTTYTFSLPTREELAKDINRSSSQTADKFQEGVKKATELQNQVEEMSRNLRGKLSLDWQDRKKLEELIQQKKEFDNLMNQLNQENKQLEEKKNAFSEQDERIRQRSEQLKKLMDEVLDEETRRLFEELEKLLRENTDIDQIRDLLERMDNNSSVMEQELERTLELFKQLQRDFKLDQAIKELSQQIEEQKQILEETQALEQENPENREGEQNREGREQNQESREDRANEQNQNEEGREEERQNDNQEGENQQGENQENQNQQGENQQGENQQQENQGEQQSQQQQSRDPEQLAQDQQELKEQMEKLKEMMEELRKLSEEIRRGDQDLPSEQEMQEIQQQQDQSRQNLQQNSPSKARESQQKALEQMQKMQQQMQSGQNSMMMQMNMENMESLRQILHGLIKLSFDQEALMNGFRELQESDPRFNQLAQQEVKLREDSKVLSDSLLALGKRDPFMGSFIVEKINELNNNFEKSIEAYQTRSRGQAMTEMQSTMTTINDLALMLDDHFDNMMQMMANAQPSRSRQGQQQQQQQQGNQPQPSLQEMQNQLNQRIQELRNSGKTGRELSEELARMAAEQERIRRRLQQMEEDMRRRGMGELRGTDELREQMEQTELDLVNKRLTEEMIERQREIQTRLLDAENAMREQEMDDQREGETSKDNYEKELPKAFEEYLRLKEKEIELLKTVPPRLYPFYKKEVNEYFKRINE